ncbi:MAG TPA: SDR family NAD(P)-dependent oxidoreductase [Methanomicrobiales archaeon]|nr:SDR family NAD(P)-dependent oxidoreductase [Methanomicrobiales archaeon]
MKERTILVTGSTDGIGRAAAGILARQGDRVLIHGRNPEKGRAVLEELKDRTGSDRLDLFIADLSSPENIRQLAADVADRYDRLDVLINNAGVYMPERRLNSSGVEMTFAVNYLAPFLLTHELLPLLRRSAPARIVSTASIAHRSVRGIDWENLPAEEEYDPYEAYALSKLGIVAFTYRLAGMLEGTGVTANCLHPGVIRTKLLRAFSGGGDGGGEPPEEGGAVEAYLATSPEVEGVNGRYYEKDHWAQSSPLSRDPAVQERFWDIGLELNGLEEWSRG